MNIQVFPVNGMPEVSEGDDLAVLISNAIEAQGEALLDNDVLVVAQKVVSKAEGRMVEVDPADPESRRAVALAEARSVLRMRGGLVITETRHGFVCANSGVDSSNVPEGYVALLPSDPDRSARRLRKQLGRRWGAEIAVIISDTFGRAWRVGQTNIAIGVAGMEPLKDYRGTTDRNGRELHATSIAVADELAGAAELVMGKAEGVAAAIVRGVDYPKGKGKAVSLARKPQDDLFR